MARRSFSLASFLLRWLVALVLVFATFNPTDYSYYRWVSGMDGESLALKALAGVALVILYVIYLLATWRSIGAIGVTLAAAFLGGLVWVTIDLGLLDLARPTIMTWILLFVPGDHPGDRDFLVALCAAASPARPTWTISTSDRGGDENCNWGRYATGVVTLLYTQEYKVK